MRCCASANMIHLIYFLKDNSIQLVKENGSSEIIVAYCDLEFIIQYANKSGEVLFEDKRKKFTKFDEAVEFIRLCENDARRDTYIRSMRQYKSFRK